MKINRAYKVELDPNNKQRTALLKSAGAARWAYNWGLSRKTEEYKRTGKSPSAYDLSRELNLLKKKTVEDGGVPWMYEVSKCAPQVALANLDDAFNNFYRHCKSGKGKPGYPKFKSKKNGVGSFSLTGAIRVERSRIQLPRLGSIKLKEKGYLPTEDRTDIKILRATVSERAGRWYVSLSVEQEIPDPPVVGSHVVGVDLGVKSLAVTSDGEVFDNPKALHKAQRRLRFLQKEVSRKQKGSKNRGKAKKRLATQHARVADARRDSMHKTTTAIVKQSDVIVLESLNMVGMLKNHKLAAALSDVSLSEFTRQVEYKAAWLGKTVLKADRFYPSSKTCSNCGSVKDVLRLDERVFNCDSCGRSLDRDLNAAINLKKLAGSSPVAACCPGGSGARGRSRVKPLVGQEPNIEQGCPCLS